MNSRRFQRLFTLLSIFLIWQTDIEKHLKSLSNKIGISPGSILENLIVDIGIPVILISALSFFYWISGKLFFRLLPSTDYLGGWWIYSLIAITPEGEVDTLGYFRLIHSVDTTIIEQGRALWISEGEVFSHRGSWDSDTVVVKGKNLKFIYKMKSLEALEKSPPDYEGYLELQFSDDPPYIGKSCWIGTFNDLKERGHIKGPVYAERLSPFKKTCPEYIRNILKKNRSCLLKRVKDYLPPKTEP